MDMLTAKPVDRRPAFRNWYPPKPGRGSYIGVCEFCNSSFEGGKLCRMCADCAYIVVDRHIHVHRPMDGHYLHSQENRKKVFAIIFREGWHPGEPVAPGAGLQDFVLATVWGSLDFIEDEIGVTTQVDGFTRPIFDIVMDVYEAFKGNETPAAAARFAKALFGHRTPEVVVSMSRLDFRFSPQNEADEVELQKGGPRSVGPLPVKQVA